MFALDDFWLTVCVAEFLVLSGTSNERENRKPYNPKAAKKPGKRCKVWDGYQYFSKGPRKGTHQR